MIFCLKFCSVHSIGYIFHSTFHLRFRLEINSFFSKFIFLLEVSRELPQRSTLNTLLVALSIFVIHLHSFNPVCSYIFSCVTFQPTDFCSVPNLPHFRQFFHFFLPTVASNFLLFLGRVPNKPLDIANLFRPRKHDSPVAAAATAQVKLCPYDEEEPHIWFRLIEAQFAVADSKSQKLKYANALASLPKQVLRDILDTLDVCSDLDKLVDFLKNTLLVQFGKSK